MTMVRCKTWQDIKLQLPVGEFLDIVLMSSTSLTKGRSQPYTWVLYLEMIISKTAKLIGCSCVSVTDVINSHVNGRGRIRSLFHNQQCTVANGLCWRGRSRGQLMVSSTSPWKSLRNQLHSLMASAFSNTDGFIQQDNAPLSQCQDCVYMASRAWFRILHIILVA